MTFFDCTADLVGHLNGNGQKGMLQIDAPPVENFWLCHCYFQPVPFPSFPPLPLITATGVLEERVQSITGPIVEGARGQLGLHIGFLSILVRAGLRIPPSSQPPHCLGPYVT